MFGPETSVSGKTPKFLSLSFYSFPIYIYVNQASFLAVNRGKPRGKHMTTVTNHPSSSVRPLENPVREVPQDWQLLADSWHWWLASEALSDGTREVYEGKLRAFFRFLQHIGWTAPVENLTSEHLRHYLVSLLRRVRELSSR